MDFFREYLAHWSVLPMAVGLMLFIAGIVTLLIPIFKAIYEYRLNVRLLKPETDEKLVRDDH